jgi:uncharacterized membrane protein YeaQ/YmgE (transglycosylase-associated protein family)
MIIIGFVVGVLARFYPEAAELSFDMRVMLGIGGSLVGGVLTSVLWKTTDGKFHRAGLIMSILGASILIWGYLKLGG